MKDLKTFQNFPSSRLPVKKDVLRHAKGQGRLKNAPLKTG